MFSSGCWCRDVWHSGSLTSFIVAEPRRNWAHDGVRVQSRLVHGQPPNSQSAIGTVVRATREAAVVCTSRSGAQVGGLAVANVRLAYRRPTTAPGTPGSAAARVPAILELPDLGIPKRRLPSLQFLPSECDVLHAPGLRNRASLFPGQRPWNVALRRSTNEAIPSAKSAESAVLARMAGISRYAACSPSSR